MGLMGQDLLALASRIGFGYFQGLSSVQAGLNIEWRFACIKKTAFNFSSRLNHALTWRFVSNGGG
jgi:hypothetical protein